MAVAALALEYTNAEEKWGFNEIMCGCPGTASSIYSCPGGCDYTGRDDCPEETNPKPDLSSDSNRNEDDDEDDELSGGAKFGVSLVILSAIAAVIYAIWTMMKNDVAPKTANNNNDAVVVADVEQARPPQSPPLDDINKETTIQPDRTTPVEIYGEGHE